MKRLMKSAIDRKISGVCGGIGEYFSIDPTLIRLAFVLFTIFGGSGVLLYLVCAIVMPDAIY
jgi:phage shock protein C